MLSDRYVPFLESIEYYKLFNEYCLGHCWSLQPGFRLVMLRAVIAKLHGLPYKTAQSRPAGHAVAAFLALATHDALCPSLMMGNGIRLFCSQRPERISKMPKMKTKSGAKKRFKITGSGKVKAAAAGKRHGMIKRTTKFIQQARGTMVLNDSDAKIVKKYMPYAR
jgi:large subunit ribosomal protein L35